MSNSFTPRTRGGSDTRSFYSSRNNRRGSAAQRIQHLGRELRSYAAGEDLLERVSVPLTENYEEINEDESNFDLSLHCTGTQESPMFTFQTPTSGLAPGQRRPLTSSSRFNSSQQPRNHSDPPSHSLDVAQLLQQQQVTLMKVLKQQEELQEAQKEFSQRILLIEEQVQEIARSSTTPSSSSSPSTPVSTPKPKRRVPRSLSVSYVALLTDIYIIFIGALCILRKRFLVYMTPCFKVSSRKKGRFSSVVIIIVIQRIFGIHYYRSGSDHNKSVSASILKEVENATDSFTTSNITGISMYNIIACKLILLGVKPTIDAIRRKYEATRRQWKSEGKEGHAEMVELEGIKKKKRQRLRRV
jgi:hypothetical protein